MIEAAVIIIKFDIKVSKIRALISKAEAKIEVN